MEYDLVKIAKQTPYPLDAFFFVQRGLDFTVRKIHGEPDPQATSGSRHISGQALCQGLREYALTQYGLLAKTVLKQWHIRGTEDFGQIVFAMVNAGLMQKTPEDSIDDFRCVFDFETAFTATLELSHASKKEKAKHAKES